MSFYCVTGGAGFIGSHLVDALSAAGHQVRVLDNLSTGRRTNLPPDANIIVGDVTDPATLQQTLAGTQGCFHLAAVASVARGNEDWFGTHRVNQSGTVAVFEAARRIGGIPVVYASSAAIYGDLGDQTAVETRSPAPLSAYGADKLGSELHAMAGWAVHGLPSAGMRFFNIYGPRQDPASPYSGVISLFARHIAQGETVTIHGTGEQSRDFVYVGDAVAHLRAAMRRLEQQPARLVMNVCTGRAVSVRDLAARIAVAAGANLHLQTGLARPGDIFRSVGDPSYAVATLGLQAETTLDMGLAHTLACL